MKTRCFAKEPPGMVPITHDLLLCVKYHHFIAQQLSDAFTFILILGPKLAR